MSTSYCASSPGSDLSSNISLVQLTGDGGTQINNNTSGIDDTYEDYTSQSVTLTPGNAYTITIGKDAQAGAKVFIDWGGDGDFNDLIDDTNTFDTGNCIKRLLHPRSSSRLTLELNRLYFS